MLRGLWRERIARCVRAQVSETYAIRGLAARPRTAPARLAAYDDAARRRTQPRRPSERTSASELAIRAHPRASGPATRPSRPAALNRCTLMLPAPVPSTWCSACRARTAMPAPASRSRRLQCSDCVASARTTHRDPRSTADGATRASPHVAETSIAPPGSRAEPSRHNARELRAPPSLRAVGPRPRLTRRAATRSASRSSVAARAARACAHQASPSPTHGCVPLTHVTHTPSPSLAPAERHQPHGGAPPAAVTLRCSRASSPPPRVPAPVLARLRGCLGGEVGVGGCEMADADELDARDPFAPGQARRADAASPPRPGHCSSCSRTCRSRSWRSAIKVVDHRRLFVRQ